MLGSSLLGSPFYYASGGKTVYESTLFKFLTYTVGGSIVTFLFGGWSDSLTILFTLMVCDYISGWSAAVYEGKKYPNDNTKGLNSRKGTLGVTRKAYIFMIIAVLYQIDKLLGLEGNLSLMNGASIFYIGNELISLLENYGRMNLPLPPQVKDAIAALKGKTETQKKDK